MALGSRTAKRVLNAVIDAQYLANNVLFINNDIVALNKPYGIPVHSGPGIPRSISDFLEELSAIKGLDCKLELAHRLDKCFDSYQEAHKKMCAFNLFILSPSIVICFILRNRSSAQKISEMFHDGKVGKKYWAITVGVPKYDSGKISIPVGYGRVGTWSRIVLRRDLIAKSFQELKAAGFKDAVTKFTVLDNNQKTCSLCEIQPVTGHKQQIRVHLADGLICPILGDHKFSSTQPQPQILPLRLLQLLQIKGVKRNEKKDEKGNIRPWQRGLIPLHLHARELVLPGLNNGKDLVITAPAPHFFEDTLNKLKLHPKRSTMIQTREEAEYYKLRRLGKSSKKFVGF
ncbi:hypothetical protein QZH41_010633 [Actinostola sp. cb2023]|nr:hypothetical protein QZH41_010633 [Actinostola sp. cb2023]